MKKYWKLFVTAVVAVLASVLIVLSACTTSVAGKTYAFDDIQVNTERELTESEQTVMDTTVNLFKRLLGSATLTFNDDGTISVNGVNMGTYTQDGDQVSFGDLYDIISGTWTARGDTLENSEDLNDFVITVIFKQQ